MSLNLRQEARIANPTIHFHNIFEIHAVNCFHIFSSTSHFDKRHMAPFLQLLLDASRSSYKARMKNPRTLSHHEIRIIVSRELHISSSTIPLGSPTKIFLIQQVFQQPFQQPKKKDL